ncbi:MAG: PQQ-binding-like beta-propeller repeat protein [Chloroflexota bacterium]|nr:MAG: hypothetical protein DLM70_17570 [Chloroflexota bacterium]
MRRFVLVLALIVLPLLTTAEDWPSYLQNPERTSSSGETMLSKANAGELHQLWAMKTAGTISASTTVVNNVAYVGSWDGYEYALNPVTGQRVWRTYLGVDNSRGSCGGKQARGISSTASVQGGVLYVGGGDSYWYALSASTGSILWKVLVGSNATGHYNWASPLVTTGDAYVGVSSLGDCPVVQGQLLDVNLKSRSIVTAFNVVPSGQKGGGIWGSPATGPKGRDVYVGTGNEGRSPASSQPATRALLAIGTSPWGLRHSWQVPDSQVVGADPDFGSTPTLFNDAAGRTLIGVANKNGFFYAFDRTKISAGPVWQSQVAVGGDGPQKGFGSISPAAFDGRALYVAGGNTTINGTTCVGSVRALDPATGGTLWQHCAPGVVLGAVADVNGLVIDCAGSTLEVLDASSGTRLYAHTFLSPIYASPSVSNGRVFVSTEYGLVYGFGV